VAHCYCLVAMIRIRITTRLVPLARNMRSVHASALLLSLSSLTALACSGSSSSGGASSAGNSSVAGGGASAGGASSSQAGTAGLSAGAGGKLGSGGGPVTAGTSSVGGSPATGGSVGAGGSPATGGTSGSGGAAAGAGGTPSGGTGGPGGDLPPVYTVENTGADCPVPTTFPDFNALTAVPNLPDPFKKQDGTQITSKADWRCRRAEISAQLQHWEIGTKPAPPAASDLTATFSGNKLSVTVKVGSKSITLNSTITTPSGAGPFPVLIQMDGSGVPASIFTGAAIMSFTSSALASQFPSRDPSGGQFWSLFQEPDAGAYAGWSWGVSRLIDGLVLTAAQNKIDTKHIAVTGCSYAGKMALWAGAFDERIALTIPEESGGGGEASWRMMATQTGTEDLEAAQGTGWYSTNLLKFKNADAPKLPFDQHSLVAMVAPRAILTIANTSIDRLGSQAGYVSMKAAAEVYTALGVPDRIGWSQVASGAHCAGFGSQAPDVKAYVDKFLFGKTSSPVTKSPYTTDMKKWITWPTPTLK